MNRSRPLSRIAFSCAVVAACSADGPTAPDAQPLTPTDLLLSSPTIVMADLVSTISQRTGRAAEGPALADGSLVEDVVIGETEEDETVEIWNAHTNVGFDYDHAYSEGSHQYTGQVGRVETTAHVTFNDAYLGSQTALAQEYDWLTLRTTHFVTAYAQVNTDHSCGLEVQGRSTHAAWSELFQLKGAPSWGKVEQSSSAGPIGQERCGHTISNSDPTGTYKTEGGIMCTYLITYDVATREILDVELLFCGTTDGEKI